MNNADVNLYREDEYIKVEGKGIYNQMHSGEECFE